LTDGRPGGTVTFEAFGIGMVSLGTITTVFGDGSFLGTTAEDRFFGVKDSAGIIAIKIIGAELGITEVDHIQYGELEGKKSCDALDKASENGKGKKKGLERAKANNNC